MMYPVQSELKIYNWIQIEFRTTSLLEKEHAHK